MRVVLNFIGLRVGGGRTDAINLLHTLPKLAPEIKFLAIVPSSSGYEELKLSKNCELRFEPIRPLNDLWRLFYDNFILTRICKNFGTDVLFTMCNNGPIKTSSRHVLMLRRPQLAYRKSELLKAKVKPNYKIYFLKWYFQQSLKYCDVLIVQTQTMKNLVRENYAVESPICIVGKSVSKKITTTKNKRIIYDQIGLLKENRASKKFLYLTKYYPHKNIELAAAAFYEAKKSGNDICLVLTLEPTESLQCKEFLRDVYNGVYGDSVINIGTVDLASISTVYSFIDAVFMPTLLESYSATFLEATAYDKPLFASDRQFTKEICGKAAIYFEPLSIKSMVNALKKIHNHDGVIDEVIELGKLQYQRHDITWESVAHQYLDILTKPELSGELK